MKLNFLITILVFSLIPLRMLGQAATQDFLHSTGKMYAVYAVVLVMFLLIAWYLIVLDKRLRKLEQKASDEHKTS